MLRLTEQEKQEVIEQVDEPQAKCDGYVFTVTKKLGKRLPKPKQRLVVESVK